MRTFLDLLDSFLTICDRILIVFTAGGFGLMMLVNAVNIFWRSILGTSLTFVFPWSGVMFCWLTFGGFFVYFRRNQDVVVDMLVRYLPKALQTTIAICGFVLVGCVALLITVTGDRIILSQTDPLQMVGIPRWSLALPLFISTGLIVLECIHRIGAILLGLRPAFIIVVPPEVEVEDVHPHNHAAEFGR